MLTVTEETHITKKNKLYKCICDCGNFRYHTKQNLLSGTLISCGCYKEKNYGKRHKNWRGKGQISLTFFDRIKMVASTRSIPFEITIDDVAELFEKQEGKCALSGLPLLLPSKSKQVNGKYRTASLDRINSNLPYQKDNIQWVHKDVNMMKQQFSTEHFLELCSKIHNFNQKNQ